MSVKIEEFVAHLGWEVDSTELKKFKDQVKDTATFFAKVGAAIIGATGALTAFTVATTKQVSIQTRLAEAYGMSAAEVENWGFLLGAVGLEAENVIRAAKDLNVRLGQAFSGIGDANTIKDAVHSLGIEFESLRDQKPEEQFKTILQAAKDLDDQQAALAASQQLLGRQGAIVTGYLRDQEGTIEDLLKAQAEYNFLTEENRDQAKEFIGLWDNTGAVIDSAKASFASYLSEALAPLLKEFLEWVRANRELIKLKIAEWAEKVGRFLEVVFRVLKNGLFVLDKIIDAFGGLENVLAAVSGIVAGMAIAKLVKAFQILVPLIWSAVKAQGAWNLVMQGGKLAGALGLLVLLGLAINSLVRFFQGRDSLVGDIGDAIAEQMHVGMEALAEFFGFSKDEFDMWLVRFVDDISDAFGEAWTVVSGFFKEMAALDWGDVADRWMDIWSSFVRWLEGLWDSFVNWLTVTVPNQILSSFRGMLNKIVSLVKEIPLIGGLVGESPLKSAKGGLSAAAATVPQVSPGVLQTINQTRSIQRSVSNVKGATVSVNSPITVHQQPGESGEALSRRITKGIRQEFAAAVRDNDTGVEI